MERPLRMPRRPKQRRQKAERQASHAQSEGATTATECLFTDPLHQEYKQVYRRIV